jgi:acetylornithine deacetylase/succinyl-diaminopimelate desuccinylase-like protein
MEVNLGPRKAHAYIDDHLNEHIARIQEFVRFPTISTQGIGIVEGAYMLTTVLRKIGFPEVELVDVGGRNPGVWAAIDVGAKKTIASYAFFDSRPVGDRPWIYQPFGAAIVNDPQKGRMLIGRGASSPKGPLMAWINALEAMVKTDELPVNVMLLIEGDEIEGSPTFPPMFQRYRERLRGVDACFAGGMTQSANGDVSLNLGYRGLLYLELEVSGERWRHGPIGIAAHSSLKNCIESPVSRLAHLLSTLSDETGAEIRVPGIEQAADPSDEDERLLDALLERYGEGGIKTALGLGSFEHTIGEASGRSLLMRYMYAPSLNVNGVYAGYHGPGTEVFTVPEKATARLDLRLPPGTTCEHAIRCLRAHLEAEGYGDAGIRVMAAADWSRTPVNADIVQAVLAYYRSKGFDPVVWPYQGGGGPWSLFKSDLDIPIVRQAGLGGGGRRDRGDEYLLLDGDGKVAGLADSEKSQVDIVHAYSVN